MRVLGVDPGLTYGRFIARAFAMRGTDWRMLPTAANGQPALAAYVRDGDAYVPHTVQVLTVTGAGISRNVVFQDRAVFTAFGLAPMPAVRLPSLEVDV